jgi:hypothetical protein
MDIFGKTGVALLPLLTSNIAAAREEAERLGLVMSADVAHAADDLGDSIDTLTAVWDGLLRNFEAAIVTSEPLHQLIAGLTAIFGSLSKEVNGNRSSFRDFVDQGVVFVANALVPLTEGVELAAALFKALADVWTGVVFSGKVLAETLVLIYKATTAPSSAKESWKEFKASIDEALTKASDDLAKHEKALEGVMGVTGKVKDAAQHLADVVANSVGITHKATEATTAHGGALGASAEATKKAEAEAAKYNKAVADEFDRIMKAEGIHYRMADELKAEAEATKLAAEAAKDLADMWADVDEQIAKIVTDDYEAGLKKNQQFVASVREIADAINSLGGPFANVVANGVLAFANLKDRALQAKTALEKTAIAIQGVAAAFQAGAAAGSKFSAALSGAASGAAAGAAFGPWGIAIGAVGGAILGLIGHHKALNAALEKSRIEGARLRDEFVKEQGGFNELAYKARQAGVSIDELFRARTAEGVKKAIQEINDALDTQKEAQEALKDAAERYGFTIEELGPKFAKNQLDEQMGQILKDWKLLEAAGVDHEAMLARIGPAVGGVVDQYVRAGVEIPSAMKDIIDDLYTHHRLLHENGEEYSEAEYKALQYGHTTGEMFDTLIAKIDRLVSALLGIPDHLTTTIDVNENHHEHHDPPDPQNRGGGGGEGEETIIRGARGGTASSGYGGGMGNAGAVTTSSRGPGSSGPTHIIVPVSIGGHRLDEVVLQRTRAGWMRVS